MSLMNQQINQEALPGLLNGARKTQKGGMKWGFTEPLV